MKPAEQDLTKFGFIRTFVLPALLIFLLPIISCIFFLYAQGTFDRQARDGILKQIRADQNMPEEERAKAIAYFTETPVSRLMAIPEFAANFDSTTRFYFATFRWMIRLSVLSIVGGVGVFALVGMCVLLSLRSQFAQYLSLLVGWHVLRIYGALQTIVMGVLLVALSFWVPAIYTNTYYVKLIVLAGILAIVAVGLVIVAIFKRPPAEFYVKGKLLASTEASSFWDSLNKICSKVGTAPPDHVIAGIDDNFFVTEYPVTVDGKEYRGKTLFVSLPLLKQLNAAEAETVLAHEMAHFSGNDTLYSRRISPLLQRYNAYLQDLYGVITRPVFYVMLCFRALFELSLGQISRQREFRADEIAAATTSPRDFAGAMLRIAAYSRFRNAVQEDLFKQEQLLETANVSDRIESGFLDYAISFATDPEIGMWSTAHPFDSHPPMMQRLSAVGIELCPQETQSLLEKPGDGGWYHSIPFAQEMEREQWHVFEEQFRNYHEQTLPYRFLPETDEQRKVVEKMFPSIELTVKEGTFFLDCEKILHPTWPDPLLFSEITHFTYHDSGALEVHFERDGKRSRTIQTKKLKTEQRQELLDAINRYFGRYLSAAAYQHQLKEAAAASKPESESAGPW